MGYVVYLSTFLLLFIGNIAACDTFSARVAVDSDDAEEQSNGSVDLASSDLELVYDGNNQHVGIRWQNVTIPQGATIDSAYIQFHVDETDSGSTSVTIVGENADDSATFTTATNDVSGRATTTASVNWDNIPAWSTVHEEGANQKTPDIKTVIQEIVDRTGWVSGNALSVIITGTGTRTAESYRGESASAPMLSVTYTTGDPNDPPPSGFDPQTAHDDLLTEAVGYFAHAGGDGGSGGDVVYVQNLNDSGTGSLREAMTLTGAKIVLFEDDLTGTITFSDAIEVASDKTLWGRHRDGTSADIYMASDYGVNSSAMFKIADGASDVIIANIKGDAAGPNDDAPDFVGVGAGGSIVWVHHVTGFGDGTDNMDGFVDVTDGGTDVTISWSRIIDWSAAHLIRSGARVTLHHNHWSGTRDRQPRSTGSGTKVHAYNNWVQDWGGAGMHAQYSGELLSENNVFDPGSGSDLDEAIKVNNNGIKEESGNLYTGGSSSESCNGCNAFSPPYSYSLVTADQSLRDDLAAVGWQSTIP